MKDLNELLQQFEDFDELSISEESVGAYIEGRLEESEFENVRKVLASDKNLSEVFLEVSENTTIGLEDTNNPWDMDEGNLFFRELGLPPTLSLHNYSSDTEQKEINSDRIEEEDALYLQNAENSLGNNLLNSNIIR